jgi:hypothetical protein
MPPFSGLKGEVLGFAIFSSIFTAEGSSVVTSNTSHFSPEDGGSISPEMLTHSQILHSATTPQNTIYIHISAKPSNPMFMSFNI